MEENKMGIKPVGKLLFEMSVPAMLSMLIQALYNVVDSIFVSRVSEAALTAVSLAFPMQNLLIAFAVGLSVGLCSVISRRLGEKREEDAEKAARTGVVILLVCTIVFIVIGFTLSKTFIGFYTDDQDLLKMGTDYLRICLIFCMGCFFATYSEKVLQGTGDTFHPMIIQASGAIFNIVFDPVLIFGYLGFPAMGVKGAAIATVSAQFFSMFLGIIYLKKSPYFKNTVFIKLFYDKKSCKDIITVGLPSVVMQGIGTVMTSLMNGILIAYNILATTVFGVYFKLQSFVFMPIFGITQGLLPILGYNYGSKNKKRMVRALQLGIYTGVAIMFAGKLLFHFGSDWLLGLFNASEEMVSIGRIALRTISWSFPVAGFCIVLGTTFQALGDGYLSMVNSLVRQIVFLVPCAYIFGKLGGLDTIWYSFLVAEVASCTLNIVFFISENKKKLQF